MRRRKQQTWTPERLRRLMDMKGMADAEDLAYEVKATARSVQNWLRGECSPIRVFRLRLDAMEARLLAKQAREREALKA